MVSPNVLESSREVRNIAIGDIKVVNAYNPRKTAHRILADPNAVNRYAEMLEYTEPPPIVINQDNELLDGVHRLAAAKQVGRTQIPAVVVKTGSEADALLQATLPNLKHGKPLSNAERKRVAMKLLKAGYDVKHVQQIFGYAEDTLNNYLRKDAFKVVEEWHKDESPDKPDRLTFANQHGMTPDQVRTTVQQLERGRTNEMLKKRCYHLATRRGVFCNRTTTSPPMLAYRDRIFLLRFEAGRVNRNQDLAKQYKRLEAVGTPVHVVTREGDFEDLLDEIMR